LQECFTQARFIWVEPLLEFSEDLERLEATFSGRVYRAAAGREALLWAAQNDSRIKRVAIRTST
jgi:hypothetical protein